MPAMVSTWPCWRAASTAARTRARLCWPSRRRALCMASPRSVLIVYLLVAYDVGEQRRCRRADHAEEPDRHGGVELGPASSQHGDGVLGGGPLGLGQLGEHGLAAVDDLAHRGDLLGGGDGGVAGPVLQFRGGAEPFLVGEEPVEMGAELGQVGGIGAEVGAAEALVAEWARLSVGAHVGGFLADAERHRHLADGVAEVL